MKISNFHWFMEEELKYTHKTVEKKLCALLQDLNILDDILRKIGEVIELTTWLTTLNGTTFCHPKRLQCSQWPHRKDYLSYRGYYFVEKLCKTDKKEIGRQFVRLFQACIYVDY